MMINNRTTRTLIGLALSTAVIAGSTTAAGKFSVQILSATVKDKAIPQAQVIFQKNGATSITATTNAQGQAVADNTFGADDSSVLLIVKKAGFSNLVAKCPCNGMTYAISETMTNLDGLRAVLNWGATPNDLDEHVVFTGSHVFFRSKEGDQADLDVDDTDSYGPETITLRTRKAGLKYIYAVHNYSDRENPGSTTLTSSHAKVFVYIGESLIKSYYVPTAKAGTLWIVFGIDEDGILHDINKITSASDPKDVGNILDQMTKQAAFDKVPISSADAISQAKAANRSGETAYHANNYEQAIELYNQAIELDPNYGQAWSNLGLVYQKSNKFAEAIWASRKAIELATGSTSNVVRASSYYNIAKMYEDKSEFANAKANYDLANQNNPKEVYTKAIARVSAKIGGAQ
jgi:uncharacterized protein YfaP (DUF2135 family)